MRAGASSRQDDELRPAQPVPLAARIRALRVELAALEQQQNDDLLRLIAATFPRREVFSAADIWREPALRIACLEAEIENPQQVGKWLRGERVERVGADHDGAMWTIGTGDTFQQ